MKKLLEQYGKKKVYTGISIVFALLVAITAGTVYAINMNKDKLTLKKDTFVVEYGKAVSNKAEDYAEAEKEVLKNTKVEIKAKNEKDKDYLAVGKYEGTVSYKDEKHTFKVEVKDTTAPTFKDFKEEIKIEQNAENVDYVKYFDASDLSKVELTVNSDKVKLDTIGTYEVEVTAKDAYDNKTTKKAKIEIVSAEKVEEFTETNDGEKPISAETKQKQEEQANNAQNNSTNNGGGSANNNGGSNVTPTPQPQPNGISAVINTAYSFVGRTDMSCADVVIQAFSQNGYDVPYGSSYYIGNSIGIDSNVIQAGDLLFTPNHVMLVASVSGNNITVIEGGINGANVIVGNHVRHGNSVWVDGISERGITDIRRV
ncbi:MAG: CHAP domain-containing protein [Erysipelotrichia bacterium]|nr:CHAP domain-containing protein [Erysipelotrichia bacterium]NCC54613.1 CHAP domain-containing protein [Erysipelotrichia bacterium]